MIPVFPTQLYKGTVVLSHSIMLPGMAKRVLPVLETLPGTDKEALLRVLTDLHQRDMACGHRVLFAPMKKWPIAAIKHEPLGWYYDEDVVYVPDNQDGGKQEVFSGTVHTKPGDPFYRVRCYLPDKAFPDEHQQTVRQLFTAKTQCRETAEALGLKLYKDKLVAGVQLITSPDGSIWEPAALTAHDDYNRFIPRITQANDLYCKTAAWLYGVPITSVTDEQRAYVKGLELANSYQP